mgnify:CR=1 FL=1
MNTWQEAREVALETVGPTLEDLEWLSPAMWQVLCDEWARDDLISFVSLYAKAYRPSWYHFIIADKLKQVSDRLLLRLMVVMPPRHGKSTLISRYFPPFHIGRHPDERVMATSYSARLAQRFGRHARNVMASDVYPFEGIELAQDSRSADLWDVRGHDGGYIAAGLDGSITGEGADVLLIDDPVKSAKAADSEAERENAIEWYTETAYPRLQAGGRIVVVGTRWRDDDLMGYILEESDKGTGDHFELLHLPAINAEGEALWPEMYPIPELEKRQKNMSQRMWQAQYQGTPETSDGNQFKRWWWGYWYPEGQPLPPVMVAGPGGTPVAIMPVPIPTFFDRQLQSWDMRFGDHKSRGSYVVGQIWASRGPNRYLMDQFRERVGFDDSADAVRVMTRKHPRAVEKLIEAKANGPAVINHLQKEIGGLIPIESPDSKETRANAVEPLIRAGNVFLPHPMLAPWVTAAKGFVDEWAKFPIGENDDQVDAGSQGLIAFEDRGKSETRVVDTMGLAASRSKYGMNGSMWGDSHGSD